MIILYSLLAGAIIVFLSFVIAILATQIANDISYIGDYRSAGLILLSLVIVFLLGYVAINIIW